MHELKGILYRDHVDGARPVDFIEQGKSFNDITRLIEDGAEQYGMMTFDQSLFELWKSGRVDPRTALENSSSPRDLKLKMEGFQ